MKNNYHIIRDFIFERLKNYCDNCFSFSDIVTDCIECNKKARKSRVEQLKSDEANSLVNEINTLMFFLHLTMREDNCDVDCNIINNLNECIGEDFQKELEDYHVSLITDVNADTKGFRERLSRKVLFYYFMIIYYTDKETLEEEEFEKLYTDIDYYKRCFGELECDWNCIMSIPPPPLPQCDEVEFNAHFELQNKGNEVVLSIELGEGIDTNCTYSGVIKKKGTSNVITYFDLTPTFFGFNNVVFDLSTMKHPFEPNQEYDIYLSKECLDCTFSTPNMITMVIIEQGDCKEFTFELENVQVIPDKVEQYKKGIPNIYVNGINVYIEDDDKGCLYDITAVSTKNLSKIIKLKDVALTIPIVLYSFADDDVIKVEITKKCGNCNPITKEDTITIINPNKPCKPFYVTTKFTQTLLGKYDLNVFITTNDTNEDCHYNVYLYDAVTNDFLDSIENVSKSDIILFENLDANTKYSIEVQKICEKCIISNIVKEIKSPSPPPQPAPPICQPPDFEIINIKENCVTIKINNFVQGGAYELIYGLNDGNVIKGIINITTEEYDLCGLDANTEYKFNMKRKCTAGSTSVPIIVNASTLSQVQCNKPNVTVTNTTKTTITIQVSPCNNTDEHTIQIEEPGVGIIDADGFTGCSYMVEGLDPNTTYNIYVKKICVGGILSEATKVTGTTKPVITETCSITIRNEGRNNQGDIISINPYKSHCGYVLIGIGSDGASHILPMTILPNGTFIMNSSQLPILDIERFYITYNISCDGCADKESASNVLDV